MFLYSLTVEERTAFPALARAVIRADERLGDHERDYLARLERKLAVPSDDPTVEVALAAFTTPSARRAAYFELLGIAWLDNELADEEALLLDQFVDAWALSAGERVVIHQWVYEQIVHLVRARDLFAGAA